MKSIPYTMMDSIAGVHSNNDSLDNIMFHVCSSHDNSTFRGNDSHNKNKFHSSSSHDNRRSRGNSNHDSD